jgi:ADP-ribosyl-[dinitrogen reductase] hydrolase
MTGVMYVLNGVKVFRDVSRVMCMSGQQMAETTADRSQGCLLGQVAGDSLGSLVEFQTPGGIQQLYPRGVRDLEDGGVWKLVAGQPTDDSEMALALARSIVRNSGYSADKALAAYKAWLKSGPFDVGKATQQALGEGMPNGESQANGSLMRVSPLGIYCWNRKDAAELARIDSALTHPNPICRDACAAYVSAIACAVAGGNARAAYDRARAEARNPAVAEVLSRAATRPPDDFLSKQGWVLIALQNAFYCLLHASSLEQGIIDTVHAGGDTDTNAAIAGALLGAVHGRAAIPTRWVRAILDCRPEPGCPNVRHPRPREFWPVDVPQLARQLISFG